ncbi:phospholipase A2/esterase [Aeropyrum pernix K1]|uniref:Phospholipase A2/esterase n=1 Tax=Aeropyrum pernix (strain ATCC 700893 / DSM 11879 / JCM 9820 / NBRC 100138 / K1) TaxID=272557 RepID=Q9Y9G3_AERPE|nr:DNA primase noncatalytic subunit PriX [Aeropyrum pernix]BAA81337.1 phospholipase A2/esterase [Aeropyrum pernix K1]
MGVNEAYEALLRACGDGDFEECRSGYQRFLEEACREAGTCPKRRSSGAGRGKYVWVESIIRSGVPDGRSRLILYVISRYLVNVKGLEPGEAEAVIDEFLRVCCEKHGNCRKIYKSWIRNVLRRVREGGWRPWTLERIRSEDPELYRIIEPIVSAGGG